MKFWQSITWIEAEQLVPVAKFAEELGFEGVLNGDHGVYPETVNAPYPYSPDGKPPMSSDDPYPDCWVSLAFIAAATTRLRFAPAVYVLPLRNPFEVAKAAGALSLFSDNRFVLGVGAGWMKEEFDIYGVEFAGRGKRMDEMIEIMQKLWDGGTVEYHGKHYDFPRLQIEPAPKQRVPVYVGGANRAALKRAAVLGDGWIGAGNTPEQVPAIMAELQSLRQQAGRAAEPFETIIGLNGSYPADTYKLLQEQGMTSGVMPPFQFSLGKQSSLEAKKREMEKFATEYIIPLA